MLAWAPARRTILHMWRAPVFALALAGAAGAVGVAAPVASPPAPAIAPGVTVAGLRVAGLTAEPARARLSAAVARPLRLAYGNRRWTLPPGKLGVTYAVDAAVARALAAAPGERLPLGTRVPQVAVRRYAARLARRFARPARDSRLLGLRAGRPFITLPGKGVAVRVQALERTLVRRLKSGSRARIQVPVRRLRPKLTRASFGPIVVIDRWSNTLRLYRGMTLDATFRVATGSARYPTPAGSFTIADMQRDPWWRPPPSDWAKDLEPVPPGPGNPLGTRWMGLSAGLVGIHGTPDAASIGYSASHGCIRMHIDEAAWLFEQVGVGTRVFIV
jgi:L,D-transpeptidase catalytic domain